MLCIIHAGLVVTVFGEEQSVRVRVLGTRFGFLMRVRSSSLIRSQKACMLRRGLVRKNVLPGGFPSPGGSGERLFFGFLASLWYFVHLGGASFAGHVQGLGFKDVLPTGHALWADVCGCIIFVTLGSLLGSTKNCQSDVLCVLWFLYFKLYMPALVGRPSLHSHDACMVYQVQGGFWRNCRQKHGETSFSPKRIFLVTRNPQKRFLG